MPKNIHTYRAKLEAFWTQIRHTVDYLIKYKGIEWVESNSCGVIASGDDDPPGWYHWYFNGTADDCAAVVDDLVLKMQREEHNDPDYTV